MPFLYFIKFFFIRFHPTFIRFSNNLLPFYSSQTIIYIYIITPFFLQIMKIFKKIADMIQQLDFFAPQIMLRYKSQNDYKTVTSAMISVALVFFFSFIFTSKFISMVNRQQITSTIIQTQQVQPTNYIINTDSFMFALNLNGIDMNTGDRYFNIIASTTIVNHGNKKRDIIDLQPCSFDQWSKFGDNLYTKLNLHQWLCPKSGINIELEGRFSSEIFKYIKIGLSNCTGKINGQGCRNQSQVQNYLSTTQTFQLNFYYTNTIINPDQDIPSQKFVDDTNYFTFSYQIGSVANLYLQNYNIITDKSLLPYTDNDSQFGIIGSSAAQTNTFPVNNKVSNQYMKFYIRKASNFSQINRSFYKFDQLLSYIGGLFGLIALVINLPLYYYNLLCFQLSMATQLFKQKQQSDYKENQNKNNDNNKEHNIQTSTKNSSKQKQQPNFAERNFNFFWFLIYAPFHFFKFLGFSQLKSKKLSPFYDAVKQVRKQLDICTLLKQISYFNRVAQCLLDQNQRKLLHFYPKQRLDQAGHHRKHLKMSKKIRTLKNVEIILSEKKATTMNDINEQEQLLQEAKEVKKSFAVLKHRHDKISKRILRNLDPQILRIICDESDLAHIRQNVHSDIEQRSGNKERRKKNNDVIELDNISIVQRPNYGKIQIVDSNRRIMDSQLQMVILENENKKK